MQIREKSHLLRTMVVGITVLALVASCSGPGARPTLTPTVVGLAAAPALTPSAAGPVFIPNTGPTSTPGGNVYTPSDATLTLLRQDIKHVVFIMQENRSFDNYFGTYPGADGIPMQNGVPTVCIPDSQLNKCVVPFHDPNNSDIDAPHGELDAPVDINGGKMDGFINEALSVLKTSCKTSKDSNCTNLGNQPLIVGYHDAREIPNYWAYAENFTLQDHMFESVASWSEPSHLAIVSGWSASCTNKADPMSCTSDITDPDHFTTQVLEPNTAPDYPWTDITYLLYKNNVSWAYYVDNGFQPDCDDTAQPINCTPRIQNAGVPEIWNPLPDFLTVHQDNQLSNIQDLSKFFPAVKNGTLPSVVWIAPNAKDSEHAPSLLSDGQAYVTNIINAIMQSPEWSSTAIFLYWDDWGGLYDNAVPPLVDQNGYGLRVPALVISPYARQGYIDHQVLSFDAYLKFIEDDFLNGQRINPQTDGRPDSRPDVRENAPQLGNLIQDFDFTQAGRTPLVLPTHPSAGPASTK